MEVFAFREELVAQHERSSRNFPNIRADDVAREIKAAPAGGRSRPAPHVRLNRHFRPGGWGDNLIGEGTLDSECAKIFRIKHVNDTFGKRLLLYRRQTGSNAVTAHKDLLYYAVTGLGLDTEFRRTTHPGSTDPVAERHRIDCTDAVILEQCSEIAGRCTGRVYFCFVAHPDDWKTDRQSLPALHEWVAGGWSEIALPAAG